MKSANFLSVVATTTVLSATAAFAVPVDISFSGLIEPNAATPSLDGAEFNVTFSFDNETSPVFSINFASGPVNYFTADNITLTLTNRPGGAADQVFTDTPTTFFDIIAFDNLGVRGDGVYFVSSFDLDGNGTAETVLDFITENNNGLISTPGEANDLSFLENTGPTLNPFSSLSSNVGLSNITATGTAIVPLPATMLLLGTALSGIAMTRRKKQQA